MIAERLSSGYYLARADVAGMDVDRPSMNDKQHKKLAEEIYDKVTYRPLIMRIEKGHLPVFPSEELPVSTVAVPKEVDDDYKSGKTILIADGPHAKMIWDLWHIQ